ncbi:protein kinase domain-containing protein [Arthrobacter sp. RAF14]|uniref:protein kinase domain-containing protein n=1 Tax=Arthrobacter sp. RAF14 TaxID=3233051 RepID=UPI003F93C900
MSVEWNADSDAPGDLPAPRVPGHRVVRRLGSGSGGDVWLLEDDDGARRAVKVPRRAASRPGPDGPDLQGDRLLGERLLGERWRVQGIRHPHLLPLHGLVTAELQAEDGSIIRVQGVLMDFAPGGSVGSLVAARGTLSAAEVVTVTVPVAHALAALHARGIVHGDVSGGNILFSAEGAPLLADFGQASLTGERRVRRATRAFAEPGVRHAQAAGDVYALAAVAWWCLTGEPPGEPAHRPPLPVLRPEVPAGLALALEGALAESASERPSAQEFARAVQRACPASPVQITAGAAREDHRELATALVPSRNPPVSRRSRRWTSARQGAGGMHPRKPSRVRVAATAAVVVVLGVASVLAGTQLAGTQPGRTAQITAPAESTSPVEAVRPSLPRATTPEELVAAVRQLVGVRSAALGDRDVGRLSSVYDDEAPDGSAARGRDSRLIARLLAEHRHYAGYRPVVRSVRVEDARTQDRAVLSVTVVTPSFLVSGDGGGAATPTARKPARTETLSLTLARRHGVWRIEAVAPRG